MLFANELLNYLVKYLALGVIAVVGVLCGAKAKKNKLAKLETEGAKAEAADSEE